MYQGLQLRMSRHTETKQGKVIEREGRAHQTNSSTSQPCLGLAGYRFKLVLAYMLCVISLSLCPPLIFAGTELMVPSVKIFKSYTSNFTNG